jgi:trehalose-6-phosphatase
MSAVNEEAIAAVRDIEGATVEDNRYSVSVHFRNCSPADWGRVRAARQPCMHKNLLLSMHDRFERIQRKTTAESLES